MLDVGSWMVGGGRMMVMRRFQRRFLWYISKSMSEIASKNMNNSAKFCLEG